MSVSAMSAGKVKDVAKLVKLSLSDEEVVKFQTTIPQTLDAIEVLNELDTKNTTPTSQVNGLTNVFKDDSAETTLTQDLALSNANEIDRGLFVTKGVFDRS